MEANRGVASLELLYQQASLYRSPLPAGDWQKTLRGVLYREVRRGRYVKVGLGFYALPSAQSQTSAYAQAVQGVSPSNYLQQVSNVHSTVEGMLIEQFQRGDTSVSLHNCLYDLCPFHLVRFTSYGGEQVLQVYLQFSLKR